MGSYVIQFWWMWFVWIWDLTGSESKTDGRKIEYSPITLDGTLFEVLFIRSMFCCSRTKLSHLHMDAEFECTFSQLTNLTPLSTCESEKLTSTFVIVCHTSSRHFMALKPLWPTENNPVCTFLPPVDISNSFQPTSFRIPVHFNRIRGDPRGVIRSHGAWARSPLDFSFSALGRIN